MADVPEMHARFSRLPCNRKTLLVGIDGRGGAGKSTLARALQAWGEETSVVQMDDFYRPSSERVGRGSPELGADFDWRRLRDQVLLPLSQDLDGRYQRYDWDEDALADWHAVPIGGVVIVEGNYATRSELRPFYDFTIWVEAPHELRLARGLERDGEAARDRWLNEWMAEEDRYVAAEQPHRQVDAVVDGST